MRPKFSGVRSMRISSPTRGSGAYVIASASDIWLRGSSTSLTTSLTAKMRIAPVVWSTSTATSSSVFAIFL
jgi:hypothetical protein